MREAEIRLLGCILLNNEVLSKIDMLEPKMFENALLGEIYASMTMLYDCNKNINIINVVQEVENERYSREIISKVLQEAISNVGISQEVFENVNVIIKDYKSREFSRILNNANRRASTIDESMADTISQIEALMSKDTIRVKSMKEIVQENKDNYFNEVEKPGISIGFSKIDDAIGKLAKGDVMVIGARPAVGKSALVTQIIENLSKQGKRVYYGNLEMSNSQIYERFASRNSSISLTRLKRANNFLGEEKEYFEKANKILSDYKIDVGEYKKVSEIKNYAKYRNYDLIVIDYLQLLTAEKKYSNRVSEVGDISKSVKAMAMDLDVPVIILSQLNRVSEHMSDKEPTMSELRESGDIEQDASVVLLLWNLSSKNQNFKGAKLEKNRQGTLIREGMYFDGSHMEFRESKDSIDTIVENLKSADNSNSEINEDCFVSSDVLFGELK